MKCFAHYCFAILFFIPIISAAQNNEDAIKKMFSVADDIDFLLKSESGGDSSYCKYYLANDTLYELPSHKIALMDIDFTNKDMYNNVFNFINGKYPWVLTIHPKAGAKTFYYGTAVNSVIDLYLPDKAFAEQTFLYLQKASKGGTVNNNNNQEKNNANSDEEKICMGVIAFLDDLQKTNLSTFIGDEKSSSAWGISYYSNTPLQLATETIIVESSIADYRSVSATFMEEISNDKSLSPALVAKYNQLCGIMENCLTPYKFEKKVAQADDYSYNAMSTEFSHLAPAGNSAVANLQTRPGLIVSVVISQGKNEKDQFVNSVEINLNRQ